MSVLCLRLSIILRGLYISVTGVWLVFGLILKLESFAKYTVQACGTAAQTFCRIALAEEFCIEVVGGIMGQ